MPSPFPGMNPYFEQPGLWRGFHNHLLSQIALAIAPRLAPRYLVEYEESLYIDSPPGSGTLFAIADVAVSQNPIAPVAGGSTATLEAPASAPVTGRVRLGAITRKHRWLTIRDSQTRRIVTVIEVLSPSNKSPGDDREQYLRKRRRILRSSAHLVEIDLLRGGQRMPVEDTPPSDYRVMVSRSPQRPDVQVWPIAVRQPLPLVPIPLRTGEPELTLDLKPLIDAVYDGGAYRHHLYQRPPQPPLAPADAEGPPTSPAPPPPPEVLISHFTTGVRSHTPTVDVYRTW